MRQEKILKHILRRIKWGGIYDCKMYGWEQETVRYQS